MQGHTLRRWLWPRLGLALAAVAAVAVLAVLFQPVFSSGAPAASPAVDTTGKQAPAVVEAGSAATEDQPVLEQATAAEERPDLVKVAQVPSDNCVACHTDEAVLQQLAEEPEEVVSELAEGEG